MIKMTNNETENKFAFFCDVCDKEIKYQSGKQNGECLFLDTESENGISVVPVFTHLACSRKYEESVDYEAGNMRLEQFVEYLQQIIK